MINTYKFQNVASLRVSPLTIVCPIAEHISTLFNKCTARKYILVHIIYVLYLFIDLYFTINLSSVKASQSVSSEEL